MIVQGHRVSDRNGDTSGQSLSVSQMAPALCSWSIPKTWGEEAAIKRTKQGFSEISREDMGFRGWRENVVQDGQELGCWIQPASGPELVWEKWVRHPDFNGMSRKNHSLSRSRQERGLLLKHRWDTLSGLPDKLEDIEGTECPIEQASLESEKPILVTLTLTLFLASGCCGLRNRNESCPLLMGPAFSPWPRQNYIVCP